MSVLVKNISRKRVSYTGSPWDLLSEAIQAGVGLTAADIGVTVQGYDADLATWAGVSSSANGRSLVSAANYAAMRALLDLEAGTDFYSIAAANAAFEPADATILKDADIGVSVQAYDADLTTWAGVTSSANGRSLVSAADYATMLTLLGALPVAGGSITGDLNFTHSTPTLTVGKATAITPLIVLQYDNSVGYSGELRWTRNTTAMWRMFSGSNGDWVLSNNALGAAITVSDTTNEITFGADLSVPDEAYGVGWNGSLEVPTKNAIYDKIETIGVADGDKGDITVSASGATWTIDNDVVTYAKMQNVSATSRILGRITAGAGDVEELTAANVKTILALAQADISGLTTASSPQFTGIELGHATDTTITRTSAGNIAVEGNAIYRAGGTDVPLADGGTGASLADPNADRFMFWDDSAGAVTWLAPNGFNVNIDTTTLYVTETWMVAASDETNALTTGTNKATFVFPYNVTVISVGCSVNTAGTGLTVDINESGVTILSTKITLDSGEKTSLTAATAPVLSDTSITAGNEIGIDIDAVSGTAKGLKVWMIVRRTS